MSLLAKSKKNETKKGQYVSHTKKQKGERKSKAKKKIVKAEELRACGTTGCTHNESVKVVLLGMYCNLFVWFDKSNRVDSVCNKMGA